MGVVKSPEDTYGILEHHSLGIALADTLGLDTIGANGLFLTTFDAAFAACWSLSMVRATRRGDATYSDSRSWFVSSGVGGALTVRLNRQSLFLQSYPF